MLFVLIYTDVALVIHNILNDLRKYNALAPVLFNYYTKFNYTITLRLFECYKIHIYKYYTKSNVKTLLGRTLYNKRWWYFLPFKHVEHP